MIKELENLPDISFVNDITLEEVERQLTSDYLTKYKELTGIDGELARADPVTLILYACAVQIFQMYECVDLGAKRNMLKYATGGYLDNIAALKGVTRKEAEAAIVTVRFSLEEAQASAVGVPAGTRVSNGKVYFATADYDEIAAGDTYVDIECECTTAGSAGNGIPPGGLKTLTDPVPYIKSAVNLDTSSGGSDTESDEDLAGRVYRAPWTYSVAGPIDAYIANIKAFNTNIGDVAVDSPNPVEVIISFLMDDGSLPEDSMVTALEEYLRDGNIRPLTDDVHVQKPNQVDYELNVSYYINRSDTAEAESIRTAVTKAVEEYVFWQRSVIGRDISPSMLVRMMMDAGAKRVEVTSPVHTIIPSGSFAVPTTQTVTYGGLEDD